MSSTKRIVAGLLLATILLVIAAIVRLVTRDSFAATIAQYHALHERITPADFESPVPPDEQNAAIPVNTLVKHPPLSDDDGGWLDNLDLAQPLSPDDLSRARKLIADQKDTIALLHSAATRPSIHWPGPVIIPISQFDFDRTNRGRSIARLLRLAAIIAHEDGNDPAALQHILDILSLARVFGHDGPLITHLVENGIAATAAESARHISSSLAIDDTTRPQIKKLISAFLDDDAHAAAVSRMWQCERAYMLETIRAQSETSISAKFIYGGSAPAVTASADRARAASVLPNWPAAKAQLAKTKLPSPSRFSLGQNLAAILVPQADRAIETDFRILTDAHLTAAVLAIRVYQSDHASQLPQKLTDLVPQYLPRIPADPLAAGDTPIQYHMHPTPILYSVNRDSIDNGGDAKPTDKVNSDPWSAPDYVIPLAPRPRSSTSTPSSN